MSSDNTTTPLARCSFCGKSPPRVVGGPAEYGAATICYACVVQCVQIMSEEALGKLSGKVIR